MKKIIALLIIGLFSGSLFAQQDVQAKAALERAANIVRKSALKVVFSTTIASPAVKKSQNINGTLFLKGDKFKLLMNDAQSFFDGKTQWVYVPDSKEVTISSISSKDQTEINPLSVLSQYDGKDSKILFNQENKSAGLDVIDIYPAVKSTNEFRIIVKLSKQTGYPTSIQLFHKDGSTTTILIKSFQIVSLDNSTFTLNPKSYPGVSINDLR
jgi:chaperone LolA